MFFKDYGNKNNMLIVANDDKVFNFGSNRNGVLGFDNEYSKIHVLSLLLITWKKSRKHNALGNEWKFWKKY